MARLELTDHDDDGTQYANREIEKLDKAGARLGKFKELNPCFTEIARST